MAKSTDPVITETAAAASIISTPTTAGDVVSAVVSAVPQKVPWPNQRSSIHEIYALPAPIRTFPLPPFHPTNPLSLIYIVSTWVSQTLSPPVEPSVIHDGIWHPETRSVHVTNPKSMRALWEQGFYGKGSLSRSEPHWLERQEAREGLTGKLSSEIRTAKRREERQRTKWERAKSQQQAIEETRRVEAERHAASHVTAYRADAVPGYGGTRNAVAENSPVGPLEILMMPNSQADLEQRQAQNAATHGHLHSQKSVEPRESNETTAAENGHGTASDTHLPLNGVLKMPPAGPVSESGSCDESKLLKKQKSVRFSPTVESTTFNLLDPPNPNATIPSVWATAISSTSRWIWSYFQSTPAPNALGTAPTEIYNKEHLQLTPEEAFFLAFTFGSMRILHPSTKDPIPLEELLVLFRQHSYLPPRVGSSPELPPDDLFLTHYVVYHHFRSMGWCVRSGIKFGVDWLLYLRGPVFNHAEFGILVIPSYSHQWWKDVGQQPPQKSWNWLSGINRTLSQVFKTMVIVYVDIPPPPVFKAAIEKDGLVGALGQFKVREMMMRRWLHNRNRSAAPGPQNQNLNTGAKEKEKAKANEKTTKKGNGKSK